MPVRSRGPLLAGAGTLLLAYAAGCQSRPIHSDVTGPGVQTVAAASLDTPRQSHFSYFRRACPTDASTPATATVAAPTSNYAPNQPNKVDNRRAPDSAGDFAGAAVVASSWRPVQRADVQQTGYADAAPGAFPGSQAVLPLVQAQPDDSRMVRAGMATPMVRTTDGTSDHPLTIASAGQTSTDGPSAVQPDTGAPPPVRLTPLPAAAPDATSHGMHLRFFPHHDGAGVHGAAAAAAPLPPPNVPREYQKQSLPPYRVEPPDILLIRASSAITLRTQPLDGAHLVRPDGSIQLGIYGSVYVSGLTLDEVADQIAAVLHARKARGAGKKDPQGDAAEGPLLTLEQIKLELQVDVIAYNSKVYYIVTDGGGFGEAVYRVPSTGNETVLDAMSVINGLPSVASKKKIWVARAHPDGSPPMNLPVDWCGIVQRGEAETNYQIFPGDRIYVNSESLIRAETKLGKFLAIPERLLGITLLGSSTVNSIKNSNVNGNNIGR